MFKRLSEHISRTWPIWLAGWLITLGVLWYIAPPFNKVAKDGEFIFLPTDMPSRLAEEMLQTAFPRDKMRSSLVLVLARPGKLTEEDKDFIGDTLVPALQQIPELPFGIPDATDVAGADPEAVAQAKSEAEPTDLSSQPETARILRVRSRIDRPSGALLVSRDNRATLVIIELNTEFLERRIMEVVSHIEGALEQLRTDNKIPAGLQIGLTGNAAVGRDILKAQYESADAIEFWTVWIVIALLLAVYRAPLVAMIPLATLFCAVEITMKLSAILAQYGIIELFTGLDVYTTVLVYGAGVDFSLFLISRQKEEFDAGAKVRAAVAAAIALVGAAVAASACTEIFGVGMLAFAQFGKFHDAGITISLGLAVMLFASLTFTPSMLRLLGRWAFWPMVSLSEQTPGHSDQPRWLRVLLRGNPMERLWGKIGMRLERRPGTIWLVAVALMMPLAVLSVWHFNDVSYGLIAELSGKSPSVAGTKMLGKHFSPGAHRSGDRADRE